MTVQPTGVWLNQPGGLAERLVRIRKTAGLTGVELAAQLGWPRSKVPKLENGRQMPTEADITGWVTACGQPDERADLLALLDEAQSVYREWRLRLRSGHAALQAEYDTIVRGASRIRNFETLLVPGLLQTPDYARSQMEISARRFGESPDGVEEAVAARARRQEVLYDSGKTFEFVICEAAVRYLTCPVPVMSAQIDRLLTVTGLANVTFGVIPPGRELAVVPILGFLMVDDLVIMETYTSEVKPELAEASRYGNIMDDLLAAAETGAGARELLTRAARDLII
jgi:transcriptional regulator with XRE-family HTH domain